MNLNKKYSRARVDKNLSGTFSIQNGLKETGGLSPLLFNFALECALRRVQANQESCKLNGGHQLSIYVDDVNMMGGRGPTTTKNTEDLLVSGQEMV
jgi:hypothetical protein